MKFLSEYKTSLGCSDADEVFIYFQKSLNDSITDWNYFVNWAKVTNNYRGIEVQLNTLNYLVGKQQPKLDLEFLLRRDPSIAQVIPILLACRDDNFKILVEIASGNLDYENFSFRLGPQGLTDEEIKSICRFAENSGLLALFTNKTITSIPNYVLGVEVGLDSNGRKNRGGQSMENIVSSLLQEICKQNGFPAPMLQATSEKIKKEWNIHVTVDKSSRKFDFAINTGKKLFLIETNYYGNSGSKLKATAGEYKDLFNTLKKGGHSFMWITDGGGWKSTLRPLEEAFKEIDFVFNLNLLGCIPLFNEALISG